MPTWSKKTFAPGCVHQWAAVQDTFQTHYMTTFPAHWSPDRRADMMLLKVDAGDGSDILYMSLPDGARLYDGFEPVSFRDIPPQPDLLIADQIGYDQLFRR
jgi:hypothetical protein